ncbi:unnamed protein product [Didymodactylos carnosus]|uniref:Uncharacterized protein n=1 Tax=Didymodactylos carnosus TaxID=1234261 RepID=A0A814WQ24_9BILA|nr:unnamed protein product [Didymodactylos carnosus]CAF3969525.1 unnamed protein product [Didymodactylos carnosus]
MIYRAEFMRGAPAALWEKKSAGRKLRLSRQLSSLDVLKTASVNELPNIYELLSQELRARTKSVEEICQKLNDLPDEILTATSLIDHNLYIQLIPNTLRILLEKWHSEDYLTNDECNLFELIVKLLSKLVRQSAYDVNKIDKIQQWLLNLTFIGGVFTCVLDIAKGRHLQDNNIENLGTLLEIFSYFQTEQKSIMDHPALSLLLDSVVACLSSSFYIDTFIQLHPETKKLIKSKQFLLVTCTDYFNAYTGNQQKILANKLVQTMIENYINIYEKFLIVVDQWSQPMTRCICSMTIIILSSDLNEEILLGYEENLIENFIKILNSTNLLKNISPISINSQTLLIQAIIHLIYQLCLNDNILKIVKDKQLTDIITKFTQVNNGEITLEAYKILELITPDSEFTEIVDPVKVAEVAVNNLTDVLNSSTDVNREKVLTGLKSKQISFVELLPLNE